MVQVDQELFEILRELRSTIATRKKCPAYMVFPDKTLSEIALKYPTTMEKLGSIYGVGKTKLSQYGEQFLEVVNRYIEEKKAEGVDLPHDFAVPEQKDNGVDNIQIEISPINHTSIFIENFGEIRERLDYFLDFYRNAAYTPENLYQAIQDRASLNKLKKALKVKEKEIKDICLEPFRAVQFQFKDLIAMIDEPLTSIAEFTSEMEQVRKDEKCAEIKLFYDRNAQELGAAAELIFQTQWFYDKKWENKTCKEQQWKRDIRGKIDQATHDLQMIKNASGPHTAAVIAKYIETGSTIEAARYLKRITNIAAQETKPPVSLRGESAKEGEPDSGVIDRPGAAGVENEPAVQNTDTDSTTLVYGGPQHDYVFRVKLNEKQYQLLTSFMEVNNIEYEIVF